MEPRQHATNMIVGEGSGHFATNGEMKDARFAKHKFTSRLIASSLGFTVLDSWIM